MGITVSELNVYRGKRCVQPCNHSDPRETAVSLTEKFFQKLAQTQYYRNRVNENYCFDATQVHVKWNIKKTRDNTFHIESTRKETRVFTIGLADTQADENAQEVHTLCCNLFKRINTLYSCDHCLHRSENGHAEFSHSRTNGSSYHSQGSRRNSHVESTRTASDQDESGDDNGCSTTQTHNDPHNKQPMSENSSLDSQSNGWSTNTEVVSKSSSRNAPLSNGNDDPEFSLTANTWPGDRQFSIHPASSPRPTSAVTSRKNGSFGLTPTSAQPIARSDKSNGEREQEQRQLIAKKREEQTRPSNQNTRNGQTSNKTLRKNSAMQATQTVNQTPSADASALQTTERTWVVIPHHLATRQADTSTLQATERTWVVIPHHLAPGQKKQQGELDHRRRNAAIAHEAEEAARIIDELTPKLKQVKKENRKLRKLCTEEQQKLEEQANQLNAVTASAEQVRQEWLDLKKTLDKTVQQAKELGKQAAIAELTQIVGAERRKLQVENAHNSVAVQADASDHNHTPPTTQTIATQTTTDLIADVQELVAQDAQIQSLELAKAQAEAGEDEALSKLQQYREAAQAAERALQGKIADLEAQLQQKKQQLAGNDTRMEEQTNQINTLTQQLDQLSLEQEKNSAHINELEETNAALTEKLAQANETMAEQELSMDSLEMQLERIKQSNTLLSSENSSLTQQAEVHIKAQYAAENRSARLHDDLEALQKSSQNTQRQLEAVIQQKQQSLSDIQDQADEALQNHVGAQRQIDELQDTNQELQQKIQTLKSRLSSTRNEAQILKQEQQLLYDPHEPFYEIGVDTAQKIEELETKLKNTQISNDLLMKQGKFERQNNHDDGDSANLADLDAYGIVVDALANNNERRNHAPESELNNLQRELMEAQIANQQLTEQRDELIEQQAESAEALRDAYEQLNARAEAQEAQEEAAAEQELIEMALGAEEEARKFMIAKSVQLPLASQ